MLDIRIRIRTDINLSKRIRSWIRSENMRTVFMRKQGQCWQWDWAESPLVILVSFGAAAWIDSPVPSPGKPKADGGVGRCAKEKSCRLPAALATGPNYGRFAGVPATGTQSKGRHAPCMYRGWTASAGDSSRECVLLQCYSRASVHVTWADAKAGTLQLLQCYCKCKSLGDGWWWILPFSPVNHAARPRKARQGSLGLQRTQSPKTRFGSKARQWNPLHL
jgi:hypothetical protein